MVVQSGEPVEKRLALEMFTKVGVAKRNGGAWPNVVMKGAIVRTRKYTLASLETLSLFLATLQTPLATFLFKKINW